MTRLLGDNREAQPGTGTPADRRGITLVEILVSIGILAVGLLGVAALFPVGGHFLRQGDISDRADAVAQVSHSEAVARGLLNPDNWLTTTVQSGQLVYGLPFADLMRSSLRQARVDALTDGVTAEQGHSRRVGSAYVIDPAGVGELMQPPLGVVAANVAFFPASINTSAPFVTQNMAWRPWAGDGGVWPVRRLTVNGGAGRMGTRTEAPMLAQADAMVGSADDLAIELNDYRGNRFDFNPDNPSQQRWDSLPATTGAGVTPLKRLNRGDYSWAMTVVPQTPDARNALADSPQSHSYDITSVVFHKRSSDEALVRAAVATRGVGGGSLRLYAAPGAVTANGNSPIEDLRGGQWVMLLGPHPSSLDVSDSTYLRPMLFCQWYRVVAVEEDPDPDRDPNALASVFLRGPDWPWAPALQIDGTPAAPGDALASDLRLVIAPDVVAVQTRAMRLSPGAAWDIE